MCFRWRCESLEVSQIYHVRNTGWFAHGWMVPTPSNFMKEWYENMNPLWQANRDIPDYCSFLTHVLKQFSRQWATWHGAWKRYLWSLFFKTCQTCPIPIPILPVSFWIKKICGASRLISSPERDATRAHKFHSKHSSLFLMFSYYLTKVIKYICIYIPQFGVFPIGWKKLIHSCICSWGGRVAWLDQEKYK